MKKFFMMIVVSMIMVFTTGSMSAANINVNVNTIAKAIEVAKEISVNDSVNGTLYNLNLNKHIVRLSEYLDLNGEQSEMLYDVQNSINHSFKMMNTIKDEDSKKNYFNNLICYWRQHAYYAIVIADKGDADYAEQRLQFRKYWCLVSQTMMNKGIISRDNSELIINKINVADRALALNK